MANSGHHKTEETLTDNISISLRSTHSETSQPAGSSLYFLRSNALATAAAAAEDDDGDVVDVDAHPVPHPQNSSLNPGGST